MSQEVQQFDTEKVREARFGALVPFIVFMVFYLGLSLLARDFYKVPMPLAFLVASAVSMFLDHKEKLANKVEVYAHGMGEANIMLMCLIFILSGAFASIAKGMGAVDAAVVIARNLVPSRLMVIGMFLVSCFISLAIGTSCGTIAALTPIAVGLVGPLGINPTIMLGAVVGGAMFGDNLSMISDTTIAATRTQGVQMRDKFLANLKIVLPAVAVTLGVYLSQMNKVGANIDGGVESIAFKHILLILPYILILICALCGLNVMLLLFCGTLLAFIIGCINGSLDFWGGMDMVGKGALGMSETLIVAILAGGLLKVIRYNGGIDYIMNVLEKPIRNSKLCELGVMLLVSFVNLFTANNTVAIVIAGPIAKTLSDKYGCSPKRIASILDTASCVVQGLIPYGAQILIAVGLSNAADVKISSLQLLGAMYYPMLLALSMIAGIVFVRPRKKNV